MVVISKCIFVTTFTKDFSKLLMFILCRDSFYLRLNKYKLLLTVYNAINTTKWQMCITNYKNIVLFISDIKLENFVNNLPGFF